MVASLSAALNLAPVVELHLAAEERAAILYVRDSTGHDASASLGVQALRDHGARVNAAVAALEPQTGRTAPKLRADVLEGAMRRNLELLAELDKTAPTEVDRILGALLAHVRSWRPQVLLSSEVRP